MSFAVSPPRDENLTIEEIDALTGSEKFRALQKRLSNSDIMYGCSSSSPSETFRAPPPKRSHLNEEEAVVRKLTHYTKDRPRRKVRLPSRESRRESIEHKEPLTRDSLEEVEEVTDILPPPPPPPESAPPELLLAQLPTPTNSPTLQRSSATKILVEKSLSPSPSTISNESIRSRASTPSTLSHPSTIGSSDSDSSKAIVIGSFKKRLKRIREDRTSKSNSRIFPAPKADSLSPKSINLPEPKPSSQANSVEVSPTSKTDDNKSSPTETKILTTFSLDRSVEKHPQSTSPSYAFKRENKSKPPLVQSSPPWKGKTDNNFSTTDAKKISLCDQPLQDEVSILLASVSSNEIKNQTCDPLSAAGAEDPSDDELPPIPPPPIPDLPPPDLPPLPSGEMEQDIATIVMESSKMSAQVGPSSSMLSRQWKEAWKQKSDVLEGTMSEHLPLFIQLKSTDDKEKAEPMGNNVHGSMGSSSESIPDLPPPTVPETPPPMLIEDHDEPAETEVMCEKQSLSPVRSEAKSPSLDSTIKYSPIPPEFFLHSTVSEIPVKPTTQSHSFHSNSSIPSAVNSPLAEDDLKSTSAPNFEQSIYSLSGEHLLSGQFNSDNRGIKFQTGKLSYPASYHQNPPLSVESQSSIKVISDGSLPVSPDLKFTRVSKQTWKGSRKMNDNLSSSASTGNVVGDSGSTPGPVELRTTSLHSFSSDNSFYNERSEFLQKHQKTSPLTAASISSSIANNIEVKSSSSPNKDLSIYEQEKQESIPKQNLLEEDARNSLESLSQEQSYKITGPLKCGQLGVIRRAVERERSSPIASFILDSNLLDTEPEKWDLDEVCQWLDLVGLGSFKKIFKEKKMNGYKLLHMDIKLFAELGIDSHEIREIFLAKIYELSNPSSSVGKMEDDFLLSVDTYDSEDWQKLKAAVNVLKNPVLDESVLLEPSAIGQFLHTDYVQSQSTPNIADLTEDVLRDGKESHFQYESPITICDYVPDASKITYELEDFRCDNRWSNHVRRRSEGGLIQNQEIHDKNLAHANYTKSGGSTVNDWVAGLPEYGRRTRSHTEPVMPPDYNLMESPLKVNSSQAHRLDQPNSDINEKDSLPPQLNIVEQNPPKHTPTKRSSSVSSTSDGRSFSSTKSPTVPPTTTNNKLIKIFMNKVQKGSLYKSFFVNSMTTAEDIVTQALIKANMVGKDPSDYRIMEVSKTSNGSSRFMEPSENIMESSNRQLYNCHYELIHTGKLPIRQTQSTQPRRERKDSVSSSCDQMKYDEIKSHIHFLERKNTELQKQTDSMTLLTLGHEDLQERITFFQDELSFITRKYQKEQVAHKESVQHLQQQLDEASLVKRKLEEQIILLSQSSKSETSRESKKILENMQAKYSKEVNNLSSEIIVKEKSLQEMKTKEVALEEEVNMLHEKIKEQENGTRLLIDRNKQIHSLERDLAIKEDMIHKLLAEKEQAKTLASQSLTLKKSLQTLEVNSKQQQELSNRTVRELKEHLNRLMMESTQKEQLVNGMKKERDRLIRENQTKDALVTSFEADLASYEAVQNASMSDSSRIQSLQRSISVHEVAMASLKREFKMQNAELVASEKEVSKLRRESAKKEEQLSLLTSTDDTHSHKSLLYSAFAHQPPHSLITAHILPPKSEDDDELEGSIGIKITTFPGEIQGCVIIKTVEHVETVRLLSGDRILEINDCGVTTKSPREISELLQYYYHSPGGLKIVVARPLYTDNMQEDVSANVIERYKKLNSSLSLRLDSLNAEVEHWRQESNRMNAEILKYSTLQKDKDTEIKYLKSTVQDLKQQLEEGDKSVKQLKDTLEELEGSISERVGFQLSVDRMEKALKEKDKDITKIKAAEKSRIAELKKLKKEKEKAVKIVRQYAVNMEDLKAVLPQHRTKLDDMSNCTRSQMIATVHALIEDLAHHKAYLDQLLTVIIDQNPQLLSMIGEAQKMRDKMDDNDSWC